MAELPPAVREQLERRTFWHFVTVNEDGTPTATPVWVDVDGDHVLVNTAIGRRKERNARRDPRVVLATLELENPYSWVEISGRVVEFVEGEEARAHMKSLQLKYLGPDGVAEIPAGERRVVLRVEPERTRSNTESGGREPGGEPRLYVDG